MLFPVKRWRAWDYGRITIYDLQDKIIKCDTTCTWFFQDAPLLDHHAVQITNGHSELPCLSEASVILACPDM